ncbi:MULTISPECIES: hypothetical protein [unclassified Streptomyces]|uniref:hypothetical protein n=1 Tax=unclassified Streptomyces TaxID=2593676 RepID=UPI001CC0F618|nr:MULTISPECIES: hypothetical protein [unclassified Streptomyces]WPO70365.1 hypothetical protein R9806_06855 [Streptomyces sp. KN37]
MALDVEGSGQGERPRSAGLTSAVATALLAVTAVLGFGVKSDLPWWAMLAVGLLTAGFAGWAGSKSGRREGVRDAVLAPGEKVVATYNVQAPFTEHTPPAAHEGPQYQLRLTTSGVQMWERSVLLWWHSWPELRVIADGARLRVHRQGQEVGTMLLERPGAAREIRLTARRHGAA